MSAHGFVSCHHLSPCADPFCMPPPTLEICVGKICGSTCPYTQTNPTHIFQYPLLVYKYISESPPDNLYYEHQFSLKSDNYRRVGNGANFFASIFHSGTATLLPFSPYAALLILTMWYSSWWESFYLWMWLWYSSCRWTK